jgi:hypothetical protein
MGMADPTYNFTLNRRMNSGAKVCSAQTELQAFVKNYTSFFFLFFVFGKI